MSSIDERIVAMKFDNKQFQAGAQETISTMAELKRMFLMDGMAAGIENISSKFNAFGAIGFTVLQTLTNAAMNFGRDIAGAVLDPLVEGGKKRALNIEQAKFQFKGLGMDVEAVMADALYAVKNTAFGLDEAAVAASQFGASGVQAGDEMKAALRGISGVAAMAGTSYSDIASVFTKVAGQGRLMGDDLNRLGTRGINAAATLGKAMGKTEEEIRQMVTEGKISFEIFSNAMSDAFGEHATKANETYTGSLSNMRAAIARIGASFATVKFETQRQMFNAMTPAIDNVAAALKPVLDLYSEFQQMSADNFVAVFDALNKKELIPGDLLGRTKALPPLFQALQNVMTAIVTVIRPIRDAFNDVFPPVLADVILDIGGKVEKFTEKLILSADAVEKVKGFFTGFFTIIKIGVNIIGGILSVLGNTIRIAWELGSAIWGLISPILTFVASLFPIKVGVDDSSEAVQGFFGILIGFQNWLTSDLISALREGGEAFDQFLKGGNLQAGVLAVWSALQKVAGTAAMIYNVLFNGKWTGGGFFDEKSGFVGVLFTIRETIIDLAQRSGEFFSNGAKGAMMFFEAIGNGLKDMFSGIDIDWNMVLATLNTGLLGALAVGVFKVIGKLKDSFKGVGKIKDSFIGVLDQLGGALGRFQQETKADQLLKIAIAIGILAASILLLSLVDPERMMSTVIALGVVLGILLGAMAIFEKITSKSEELGSIAPSLKAGLSGIMGAVQTAIRAAGVVAIAAALVLLAAAVVIFAFAIERLGSLDLPTLAKGLGAVVVMIGVLVGAAALMNKMEGPVMKAAFAMTVMASAIGMLAGAVYLFGIMPQDVLIQGAISVVTALGLLVGASVLLSKFAKEMVLSAVGMLAMAAAINMLLIPLTAFGLLPMPVLSQGFLVLTALMTLLVVAAQQMARLGPNIALGAVGMMAMAAAINQLILPLTVLGNLNLAVMIQGIIGLALVMTILVVAVNAMQKAAVGAGAMILVAGALLILALALNVLSGIPIEALAISLVVLVGLMALLIIAGAAASLVVPGLLALSGAFALIGLGMVLLAGAMFIFVLAIGLLGPALISVFGSLVMFSDQAGVILGMTGPLTVLGLALLAFGVGAGIAGIGVGILAVALVLLGAGLLLIAFTGVIGVTALIAVITAMMKLMEHVPGMLILAGAFTLLGAGVLVLGLGLVVLAAAVLLAVVGLSALIPLGALVTIAINLIMKAIEKAADKAGEVEKLVAILGPLGTAIGKVGSSSTKSAAGITATALAFAALTAGALIAGATVTNMVSQVSSSVPKAVQATTAASMAFQVMVASTMASVAGLRIGLVAAVPVITIAAAGLAIALVGAISGTISGSYGTMYNAGFTIGTAITDGMRNGIQNGSSKVSQAARNVANAALTATRNELAVRSPSKKYYEVGNFMDEGLADGQLAGAKKVTNAATTVARMAVEATRQVLSGLADALMLDVDLNPTIRPVMDLTDVRNGAGQLSSMLSVPTLRLDNNVAMANSTSAAIARTTEEREDQMVGASAPTPVVNFTQINNSPKALPEGEIYRNTRSLIPRIKEELVKK